MWTILIINLLLLRGVICVDEITKDLLTPIVEYGEGCGYLACPDPTEDVLNVHVVPATHLELGLTRTFEEHYTGVYKNFIPTTRNVKNVMDGVITSLWSDEKRKFTMTDMPYFFHWWKNRDATVRRMVFQLLRQGRLFFAGGGWSQSDESVSSYHAIIDEYTYTLRKLNATFMECGRPLITWQVDNYGHSREYASLMAQMGFDGHFINPISYDDELQRMRSKALEFVWRGSDDLGAESDIYTHKLFDGYWSPPGFCFGVSCQDPLIISERSMSFTNIEERVAEFQRLMLERQGPYYTTNHIMVVMGQRYGYVRAETWFANIDKLIVGVNGRQRHAKAKMTMFYSTPACYLKAVQKAQPTLATKQDDFFPVSFDKNTVISGYFTTRPNLKLMAREMHLMMQIAKQLQLFGRLRNNDDKFEKMHWMTGALHDHSILAGAVTPDVREHYVSKVHETKILSMEIVRAGLNNLRNSPKLTAYFPCHFNVSSCWTLYASKSFIVIYNPLPWPVTMPIRLPVERTEFYLFDPNGNMVNHSIMAIPDIVKTIPERQDKDHNPSMDDEMVFIATDIPPMGYRSYFIKQKMRTKRSIIKKLSKNKKKKYLTRQTSNTKIDADELLDDIDYEYFEDATYKPMDIIQFGNVSRDGFIEDNDYVMTPRPRPTVQMTDTSSTAMQTDTTDSAESSEQPEMINRPTMMDSIETTEKTEATDKTTTTEQSKSTTKSESSTKSESTTKSESSTKSENSTNSESSTVSESTPLLESTTVTEKNEITTKKAWLEYDADNSTESEELPSRRQGVPQEVPGYMSIESNDRFIKNEYITVNHDNNKITSMILSNGVIIYLEPKMMMYVSDDPTKMETEKCHPGPYVFRPMDPKPEKVLINPSIKVLKTEIVEEIHIRFSSYAGIALKLYKGLPYIELDWVVGPLPVEDGLGKEIFIRYVTDLNNNGVFYTDANGRQTIKRVKDARPTYRPVTTDGVGSNIYPVSSKVYIEDVHKNIRFSVFPDRGEGCTSLEQGTLDIMLHRRLFTDDSFHDINISLNETDRKHPLIIRGKHMLYLSKANYRPNKFFEKKFAKELELKPTVFTSSHEYFLNFTYDSWKSSVNEYTALRKKLPVGVQILTIQKWYDDMLIRIENYLEATDVVRNGLKTVYIDELFKQYKFYACRETLLAANRWKDEYIKMLWNKSPFVKRFNDAYGNASNLEFVEDMLPEYESIQVSKGIELAPQQIRTFVCKYEDVD